jgi:hypothetical protein
MPEAQHLVKQSFGTEVHGEIGSSFDRLRMSGNVNRTHRCEAERARGCLPIVTRMETPQSHCA